MFDNQTKQELRKGNPNTFKEVFRLMYPRLKGYCRLFISDDSQIEDIIQESFIKLWENRNRLDAERAIESLVFVMVRNRCLTYLKKQKLENDTIDIDNLKTNELQYLYQLDFTEKKEKSLEELLIKSFQEAVNELPDKMKFVFVKCKIEGRKQKEIAAELGISVKMVEKQVAKAKIKIREKLIRQYPTLILLITLLFE